MITLKQKENLLKAIDQAEGYGGCQYVTFDKRPCCVIAQLACLEGVSIKELDQWLGVNVEGILLSERLNNQALRPYPKDLLLRIQTLWDCMGIWVDVFDSDSAKHAMREVVEKEEVT